MKLPFSLFLAFKFLKPKRTLLSIITILSVLGVLIGVAVLVIVLSVMSGFDNMWREKILNFNAHVTVSSFGVMAADDASMDELEEVEGVSGVAPFVQGLVFLQHRGRVVTPFVKGIDPEREPRVSRVPEHMVDGTFSVEDDGMIIGRDLAIRLGAAVGDTVLVHSPQSLANPDELRLPEELTVTGIFEVGMWEFDMGYVLTSLEKARDLYDMDDNVHGVQVMTDDPFAAKLVADRIEEGLGPAFQAKTWMDMNRQLFGALRVEKNLMFFLLIIISVVAAFGITNSLIMTAVQKTRDIGLLKALGFSSGSVMWVFYWLGLIQGVVGTVAGIGTGMLVLKHRNDLLHFLSDRFNMELLPKELYHLAEIPSNTSPTDVLTIAVIVIVICTLAGLIPASRAARLDPVQALRHE